MRTWQQVLEMLESGEMPPKEGKSKPLLPAGRQRFVTWTRDLIHAAMLARSGDPGPAMIRRLSNAEYDRTIHDLTDVDLRPAKHFPADGAGGEGFLNASEVLEISPELLAKYFTAAKQVAAHAVLLPDGFRFLRPSRGRIGRMQCWGNSAPSTRNGRTNAAASLWSTTSRPCCGSARRWRRARRSLPQSPRRSACLRSISNRCGGCGRTTRRRMCSSRRFAAHGSSRSRRTRRPLRCASRRGRARCGKRSSAARRRRAGSILACDRWG